jgi:Na+/melibiose symporter-like transporter
MVMAANLARALVLVLVVLSIATGSVSIGIVLVALALVATAEVFADNASSTLLPMLVARDDLPLGNARIMAGFVTINQLAGPPIGALLFALGSALPFAAEAILVLFAASLVRRIVLPAHGRAPGATSGITADIVEGWRWVRHHAAVRTLVLTIFTFNITYGAAWSVLVLYAGERLGLGELGFGLITTVIALGGLLGTTMYGRLASRFSLGDMMRVGLVIETLTHLALALTTSPIVAMHIFLVFGAHDFVWGTT